MSAGSVHKKNREKFLPSPDPVRFLGVRSFYRYGTFNPDKEAFTRKSNVVLCVSCYAAPLRIGGSAAETNFQQCPLNAACNEAVPADRDVTLIARDAFPPKPGAF